MPELVSLLPPKLIPARHVLRADIDPNIRDDFLAIGLPSETWDSVGIGEAQLARFLSRLSDRHAETGAVPIDDDCAHDAYFSVRRIDGDRPLIFLRTIVWGNRLFLQEIAEHGSRLTSTTLERIDDAFMALESWTLGVSKLPATRVRTWQTPNTSPGSMKRWIRGHQIFAAITQGLIAAIVDLRKSIIDTGDTLPVDDTSVTQAADLVVALLLAAGASLEFTGDFPADDYAQIIRPTMTPPLVPETFSGLLSSDHRHLVALLREMQPAFEQLRRQSPDDHRRISAALSDVYDRHRFVCERLVGKSPSLMMASASTKSGGEQIERFKALRMKVFAVNGSSETDASSTSPEIKA